MRLATAWECFPHVYGDDSDSSRCQEFAWNPKCRWLSSAGLAYLNNGGWRPSVLLLPGYKRSNSLWNWRGRGAALAVLTAVPINNQRNCGLSCSNFSAGANFRELFIGGRAKFTVLFPRIQMKALFPNTVCLQRYKILG